MAEEEQLTSFQMPPIDSKRGQMMLIYLPEGAVIVDRANVEAGNAPEQKAAPKAAAPEIFRSDAYGQRRVEHIVLRRRHRTDWVHSFNIVFASYVGLVAILPWMITALFGVSIFGTKSGTPGLGMARGDLIISHVMPAERAQTGDVILLRNNNSWNLQVRQITSKTTTGNSTTLITNAGGTTSMSDVFTLNNSENVHYGSTYIPYLGYIVIFFTSIYVKAATVAAILAMNLLVYLRRRRSRTVEEKLAFIAK